MRASSNILPDFPLPNVGNGGLVHAVFGSKGNAGLAIRKALSDFVSSLGVKARVVSSAPRAFRFEFFKRRATILAKKMLPRATASEVIEAVSRDAISLAEQGMVNARNVFAPKGNDLVGGQFRVAVILTSRRVGDATSALVHVGNVLLEVPHAKMAWVNAKPVVAGMQDKRTARDGSVGVLECKSVCKPFMAMPRKGAIASTVGGGGPLPAPTGRVPVDFRPKSIVKHHLTNIGVSPIKVKR